MALTKSEAAKLTQDLMLRGVIETVIAESPVLRYLPFLEVVGSAVVYNRENAMATAAWYDVGDAWTEDVPTWTQMSDPLRVLGGDADVDQFLQRTYANPNDLEAVIIEGKSKALAYEFNDSFFNGDNAVNAKQFSGMKKLLDGTAQELTSGAAGAALTLDKLDELLDMVKPGKPNALFMSRRTRRNLKKLRHASGVVLETSRDEFGRLIETYDGIPVEIDDNISDAETVGASTDCSRIYGLQFGLGRGVVGYQNGEIQVEEVGPLETKNARRWRLKWYVTAVIQRPMGCAVLTGVRPVA